MKRIVLLIAFVFLATRVQAQTLPAWVSSQSLWQWFQIPNTALSSVVPNPVPLGSPNAKIVAWNGATLRRNGSVYMLGAAGGHSDYAGNEVDVLALNVATPQWVQRKGPTPNAYIIGAPAQFYLQEPDGKYRPSDTHTYYATQFIDSLDRMIVFASPGISGIGGTMPSGFPYQGANRSFSFNYATGDWDSPDYISPYTAGGDFTAALTVKHPITGDVYMSRNGATGGWWKWTASTNSWSSSNGSGGWAEINYSGAAIDPVRNRMLIVGDYAGTYRPRVRNLDGSEVAVTFGGLGLDALKLSGYPGMVFDEANDAYLIFFNSGSTISVRRVNASTWSVDNPALTGTAPAARQNGIQNSVQYVPELGGVVIANSYTGNVFFMRTSGGVSAPPGDTAPPTVSITSPAGGATVVGTITISADSADNVGVVAVQFKLDGANLGTEDITAPYSVSWDSLATTNAVHVLTATARDAAGNNATSSSVSVTVSNPPPSQTPPSSGAITSFTLTSPITQTAAPFTVGLAFKQGDIPGTPTLDVMDQQVIVKKRWNDGSVKHAIASGHAALTANTAKTINVSNGVVATGTALTAANITSANPQASVQLGGIGTVNLSGLLATPFRTWISGPEMVEAHYQSAVGTDPTLTVWFYVRLYKSGKLWIRAIIENGYLDVTTGNKSYVPTVVIGGVTVYTNGGQFLNHYAQTRWSVEGWIGGDPQVTPAHDTAYLMASKLVPNYWKRNPSATALNALYQNYNPMQGGGWSPTMGDTGFQSQIGLLPVWDALYVTSGGDARAFRSVIANSKAINSYPILWKDSVTKSPTIPSGRPNWTVYGDNQGGGTAVSAGSLTWDIAHHGSAGYLAYLITGDYYFLETMENQAALCYLLNTSGNTYDPSNGPGTLRLLKGQTRAVAWCQRTVGQLAGIGPVDPITNDYRTLLGNNANYWKAQVDKSGQNLLGYLYSYEMGSYGPGAVSPWQQHFWVQTYGYIAALEPFADMTIWRAVRDGLYRSVVGILGPTGTDNYCYTAASNYTIAVSSTNADPTTWFDSWGQVYKATTGVDNLNCGTVLGGMSGGDPASAATGYWGNLLPAIAYATEDGAIGASAAWTRLTSASNWSLVANSGFDDIPIWGIMPRAATVTPIPPPTDPCISDPLKFSISKWPSNTTGNTSPSYSRNKAIRLTIDQLSVPWKAIAVDARGCTVAVSK